MNTTENQLREALAELAEWHEREAANTHTMNYRWRDTHLELAAKARAALASPEPPAPSGLPAGEVDEWLRDKHQIQAAIRAAGLTLVRSGSGYRLERFGEITALSSPAGEPATQAPAEAPLTLAEIALEECLQLGYTIDDGRLNPPDSNEWHALVASRLEAKGLLRG